MITKQQLLDRLEAIKDGLADTDNRWGIEGVIDEKTKYSWSKMIESIKNLYQQL